MLYFCLPLCYVRVQVLSLGCRAHTLYIQTRQTTLHDIMRPVLKSRDVRTRTHARAPCSSILVMCASKTLALTVDLASFGGTWQKEGILRENGKRHGTVRMLGLLSGWMSSDKHDPYFLVT